MRSSSDFEQVQRAGRRFADNYFSMTFRPNDLGAPRLGLAVAIRTVGNAVARNRVRRIVKESFRLAQHRLPAVDIVVAARAAVKGAPAGALHSSLDTHWQKVASRCASSSRA